MTDATKDTHTSGNDRSSDFNVKNSRACHLNGHVFASRVDAALYMKQLGFKLADAAQYIRELPLRDK